MPRVPRLRVRPARIERRGAAWRVTWELRELGASDLVISQAWHPHGRFHSSRLRRSLRVPARGTAILEMPARTDLRPGERVENGFLILRAVSGGAAWRILARFSAEGGRDGTPRLHVDAVDVHSA